MSEQPPDTGVVHDMTGHEIDPYADRPEHPYVDQFSNEWAWRFEDGFNRLAAASENPEDFQQRLAALWEALRGHKGNMATAWITFCGRKLGDAVAGTPIETALRIVESVHSDTAARPDDSDPAAPVRAALARVVERPPGAEPEPPTLGAL